MIALALVAAFLRKIERYFGPPARILLHLLIRHRFGPPILMQPVDPIVTVADVARLPARMLLRRQVRYLDVDRLHLLVLGRDRTEPIADLIARQRHIFALDVGNVYEDVVTAGVRNDETVALASAERLHLTLLDRVTHGTIGCRSGSGAARNNRRWQLQMRRARRNAGHRWWRRRRLGRRDQPRRCRFVIGRNLNTARHDDACRGFLHTRTISIFC